MDTGDQDRRQRLAKVLARAGVASRRQAEALIRQGRVAVDGVTVRDPAVRVDPRAAQITVGGRPIAAPADRGATVIALHKPPGYMVTRRDPQGRKTVFELLRGAPPGLQPVGRLDLASRGLLLLTDDGSLAYALTHPRFGVAKTYHVWVEGHPSTEVLAVLRKGVPLADGPTAPAQVAVLDREGDRTLLAITLKEGRHRQIRRMLATVGHPVQDLLRVAVGPLKLGGLPEGQWRRLSQEETKRLKAAMEPDTG